jgi:hypothetical protein
MSENSKPTPQNEEVDLGQLFKMIGNAFQKFFDFIGSIFKAVFSVIIAVLAHLIKRAVWYGTALVLGVGLGYYLEKTDDKKYAANMFIETNLNSVYQVYENMSNLNNLAFREKDSVKLAELLNISVSDAAKFKGFYIAQNTTPNAVAEMFNDYYEDLDSLTQTKTTFEDYKKQLDNYSYKTHKIGVLASDKNVFGKLKGNFSEVISNNPYLIKIRDVEQANFILEENTLLNQQTAIDSLVTIYLEIRQKEAEKQPLPGSGTTLNMGGTQENKLLVNEAELIKEKLELAESIRVLRRQKVAEENIISVLADFPETGYDVRTLSEKPIFKIPAITVGLLILVFTGIGVKKFVANYEKTNLKTD